MSLRVNQRDALNLVAELMDCRRRLRRGVGNPLEEGVDQVPR